MNDIEYTAECVNSINVYLAGGWSNIAKELTWQSRWMDSYSNDTQVY